MKYNYLLRLLALLGLLALATAARAQGVRIGTAGAPDASAVLDLSPDAPNAPKGFLPPRLSQAQRDAIGSPAAGLTVFNTTSGVLNTWDGSKWVAPLTDTTPTPFATFAYTGGAQTFTVPTGGTALLVDMAGAQGGAGFAVGSARGGRVQATLTVTPGQVLTVYVGGAGSGAAGYNGGGAVSVGSFGSTGGGGSGASDIRTGGTELPNRVLVAGGAGGAGYSASGGGGGDLVGGTGSGGATGGSQTAGGIGNTQGTLGQGGDGSSGYYGGGGGYSGSGASDSGGGGGSS